MAASTSNFLKIVLQTITVILLLLGLCLTIAGLSTPAWQTMEILRPPQFHQRGLWEDCVGGRRDMRSSGWICIYKRFGHHDADRWMDTNGHPRDEFEFKLADHEDWKLIVLIFISMAAFSGFVALFTTCCSGLNRCCAFFSNLATFLAGILSIIGVVIFIRNANDVRNKLILAPSETVEQKVGQSFYLALAGSIVFLLSAILSGVYTAFLCFESRYSKDDMEKSTTKRHFVDIQHVTPHKNGTSTVIQV